MRDSDVYPLKQLVKDCRQLYDYFVARQIPMTMTIEPNEPNVKRVVSGLGYIIRRS
jgi:isochorismate hydrolase